MFAYAKKSLKIVQPGGEITLADIARNRKTPFYVYDLDGMVERLKLLQKALPSVAIHYAVKANHHREILKAFAQHQVGADVVSKGEFERALECGISGERIVFSGVGKTADEIRFALQNNVKQLNIESIPELERVASIAREMGVRAPVALRMNPDVDANTHPYIRTGFRENKFGLDFSEIEPIVRVLHNNSSLELRGLTLHIGSQIRETKPFVEAIEKTLRLFESLIKQGFQLSTLDIGGGLGIDYQSGDLKPDEELLNEYASRVRELASRLPQSVRILCEPGRFIVARFGALVGQIQYIKETPYKTFVILNTGMNHLMRPSLYEAYHRILPLEESGNGESRLVDVVGPICESADVLGHERILPASLKAGDYLAVMDAGAYGAVMASRYNLHELPDEVIVSKGKVL